MVSLHFNSYGGWAGCVGRGRTEETNIGKAKSNRLSKNHKRKIQIKQNQKAIDDAEIKDKEYSRNQHLIRIWKRTYEVSGGGGAELVGAIIMSLKDRKRQEIKIFFKYAV